MQFCCGFPYPQLVKFSCTVPDKRSALSFAYARVRLIVQSPVNQAPRGLQSPSFLSPVL